MTSNTFAGTTLSLVSGKPATNDQTGFEALTFVAGECALASVPGIMREWAKVTDELVCAETNVDVKGSSKWSPVAFPLSRKPGDAAQAIFQTLEADRVGIGSFKMVFPGDMGTIYFTAQVSKYAITDGGGQNDIDRSSVELLIQSTPVYVAAT